MAQPNSLRYEIWSRNSGNVSIRMNEDTNEDTNEIGFAVIRGCELLILNINREYQRLGYGGKLLYQVEKHMKSDGCENCSLSAYPLSSNVSTVDLKRFYEERGYVNTSYLRYFLPSSLIQNNKYYKKL